MLHKTCVALMLLTVIIAPAFCHGNRSSTLEERTGNLENQVETMATDMKTMANDMEAIANDIKSVNTALSKLLSLIVSGRSTEEVEPEERDKRDATGNTEIGDLTLKALLDAHRSAGGQVVSQKSEAGSTYVRWGRKTCGESAEMLYTGLAAGSHYFHQGGASTYQCLPIAPGPEYNKWGSKDNWGWISGAEYKIGDHIYDKSFHDQNVPCTRCYVPQRSVTIMIPARRTCPDSWTKEYEGYLMAGGHAHPRAYNHVCMDQQPEALHGLQANSNGAAFFFVQGDCNTLGRCPPYKQGAELACVVCSK